MGRFPTVPKDAPYLELEKVHERHPKTPLESTGRGATSNDVSHMLGVWEPPKVGNQGNASWGNPRFLIWLGANT